MPFKAIEGGGTVITGKAIDLTRLMVLQSGLKLEVLGMTRHGRSIYAIVKEEFNLRGSKKKVLEQFEKVVEEAKSSYKGD